MPDWERYLNAMYQDERADFDEDWEAEQEDWYDEDEDEVDYSDLLLDYYREIEKERKLENELQKLYQA